MPLAEEILMLFPKGHGPGEILTDQDLLMIKVKLKYQTQKELLYKK
jgi:hypothetical protein